VAHRNRRRVGGAGRAAHGVPLREELLSGPALSPATPRWTFLSLAARLHASRASNTFSNHGGHLVVGGGDHGAEPNRDVAIERGILTILAALPDDVELAMKGLSVLATLCSSGLAQARPEPHHRGALKSRMLTSPFHHGRVEQHQETIAKQWRPALLVLSGVENEAVAVLACSALARLAQHGTHRPHYWRAVRALTWWRDAPLLLHRR
jgi:hypothetical protein